MSRHNSDRDVEDDRLVEELRSRIVDLIERPDYESIEPYLF